MAVVVVNPDNASNSVILGTDETAGVGIYALDGSLTGSFQAGDAASIDVRYGTGLTPSDNPLVAVLDAETQALRFFSFDSRTNSATEVSGASQATAFGVEGMCFLKNPSDNNLYSFVIGGHGDIDQNLVYRDQSGKVRSKNIRRLSLGSELEYCAGNDDTGDIYFAEKEVGVWRLSGDPETDPLPEVIDVVKFGHINGEVAGIALQEYANGDDYLIVSNASEDRINVYDVADDHKFLGAFEMGEGNGIDAIEEPGGLFASSISLGEKFPSGLVLTSDDDNGDGNVNYKAIPWSGFSSELGISSGKPKNPLAASVSSSTAVRPSFETAPVKSAGDAADDPAIWVHPTNPALSTIIATDKKAGMYVYDLEGNSLQFLPVGRVNNVDIRYGYSLGGTPSAIVTASNRTTKGVSIWTVDPNTRKLVDIANGLQESGMDDPYGQCMYKSQNDDYYVYLNDTDGIVRQFELVEASPRKVDANLVREFSVGSQTEGCVADDETGDLFVGEENNAIWKNGADPETGDKRQLVASIEDTPALTADVEGMALYLKENGEGYLVVSSQGSNDYVLFDRKAPHEYIGSFSVVADGRTGIDGASETDGLDVTSANLGPDYPRGIFVAQDGRNVFPSETQNFKVVNWDDIASTLNLPQ